MKNLIFSLTLLFAVVACFGQQTIELNNWKFKTGDNKEWAKPGFDDSEWKTINVGQNWESQGYKDYDGYAWYRVSFNLPLSLKNNAFFKDSLQILLGKIDDCDQAFLNGMLLGENGKIIPVGNTALLNDMSKLSGLWDVTRSYTISANDPRLLWDQKNVLTIRVFDSGSGGGMYSLPVNIGMKDLKDYLVFDTDSKVLEIKPGGILSKTVILKSRSLQSELTGKLTITITNADTKKTIDSKTWEVNLTKEEKAFTLDFKGSLSQRTKAEFTFVESKTGTSLVRKREFSYLHPITPEKIKIQENPVPFDHVVVKDVFWTPWMELNRDKILPHMFDCCDKMGRIRNFERAALHKKGKVEGSFYFDDSDIFKTIEGAAYSLKLYPDRKFEAYIDSVIDIVVAAQWPDGYLNTYFTLTGIEKRFTEDWKHETYNAGHLIEAAIAWYQVTGKRKLLDAAIKVADNIDQTYGIGKKPLGTGHPEIELALVKLYRFTKEPRYLNLAQYLVNQRGNPEGRELGEIHNLDDKPVRELREAAGHTVRALFLYCGMADLVMETGDKSLMPPLDRVWDDMIATKMFITGGMGLTFPAESYGKAYELPNNNPDVDGCTAIAMVYFAQRMSRLHGDSRYMDVAERELYNRIVAETSLDGQKFYYGCPLSASSPRDFDGSGFPPLDYDSNGNLVDIGAANRKTYRSTWFGVPCCPPTVARFLPTIGGYVYGQSANTIFVNLYVGGTANLTQNGANLKLEQTGNYPWEGKVKIAVTPDKPTKFDLALRVPSWCEGITFKVNGKPSTTQMDKGYAQIARTWQPGDVVEINMPMPVKRVYADPRVEADRGRVALQRGPIVYCLEGVDNDGKVLDIMLPKDAKLTAEKRPDLLGGVTVITGTAKRVKDGQPAEDVKITAIPFYAWDNRPPSGEMVVWLPEKEEVVADEKKK